MIVTPAMEVKIMRWYPHRDGGVKGFVDFEWTIGKIKLRIKNNVVFQESGRRWMRFPCRQVSKYRYHNHLEIVNPNQMKQLEDEVLSKLDEYLNRQPKTIAEIYDNRINKQRYKDL